MPDQPVTALDLLLDQHREVDDLFGEFEDADGDRARRDLCAQICDKLAIHAKIEEAIFYPAVKARQTEDTLHEAVAEHLQMKRLIADLLTIDASDDRALAAMKVLSEEVRHHVHEEEGTLFPAVRKLLDKDALTALGQEMMAMVVELEGEEPRKSVPNELDEPAPLD